MSKTSYAFVVTDWQKLIAAATDNAADLPQVDPIRVDLQKALDRAREIAGERDGLRAQILQLSRDLESILIQGKDAAFKLRAGAKSQYGANSERLSQFKMKPVRRTLRVDRPKKKAASGDPTPAAAREPSSSSSQQAGAAKQQAAVASLPPATAGF